jgi:hypothetical protein
LFSAPTTTATTVNNEDGAVFLQVGSQSPDSAFQYPYNMNAGEESETGDQDSSDLKAMAKSSNVIPIDPNKAAQGDCNNPLDMGASINCNAAKAGTEIKISEPDEDQTKAEMMGEAQQRSSPPVLQIPKKQADMPDEMSRKEFLRYVVNEAKRMGSEKGREIGLASGYLAAKLESQRDKNATVHAEMASLQRAMMGAAAADRHVNHLQTATAIVNALTLNKNANFQVDHRTLFSNQDEQENEGELASNAALGLGAVQGLGQVIGATGDIVQEVGSELGII